MSRIASVHSFRGGTGKSNVSANISAQAAMAGKRVAVVDTDIQSPGIHVLCGFGQDIPGNTLNDYLYGQCAIVDAAHDVTEQVGITSGGGQMFLVPSSMKAGDIAKVLRQGYDVEVLNDGFRDLIQGLDLDLLVIDTHPGLNEETLLSITISDVLLLLMRPDKQDYQGTAVTIDVARRLEVPDLVVLLNKVPEGVPLDGLIQQVSETYDADVLGALPLSDEVASNASGSLFSLTRPDHPWSQTVITVAHRIMG